MVAGLRSIAKAMELPPEPNVRAPALDPTRERLEVKSLRPTRPLVKENRALQAVNALLTKKLKNAELIIEVQKKVAALLGNPIPNIQIDEEN
jgi:hypothetical protein